MLKTCFYLGLVFSANAACQNQFTYRERTLCIAKNSRRFYPYCSFVTSRNTYVKINETQTQIIVCSNVTSDVTLNYSYGQAYYHHLVIADSTIPVIPANSSLTNFPKIETLTLKGLKTEEIEIGAFEGLDFLSGLDLSDNNLEKVPEEIGRSLIGLGRLDLANNTIRDVQGVDFSKLIYLKYLNLTQNKVSRVYGEIFQNATALGEIDLSHNHLTEVQNVAFPVNIKSLDLSHNKIITFKVSNNGSKLRELNLGCNKICHLEPDTFTSLEELKTLLLDNNCLETLEENSLGYCPSLKELDISSNGLKHIKKDAFKYLRALKVLKLSNNSLTTLSIDMFPQRTNITNLFIDSNEFRSLNYEVFNGTFPALKSVSLGDNDWICEDLKALLESFNTSSIEVKGDSSSC